LVTDSAKPSIAFSLASLKAGNAPPSTTTGDPPPARSRHA
jgi:hypothetical protein